MAITVTSFGRAGSEVFSDVNQINSAIATLNRINTKITNGLAANAQQPAVTGDEYQQVLGADIVSRVQQALAILNGTAAAAATSATKATPTTTATK